MKIESPEVVSKSTIASVNIAIEKPGKVKINY